MSNSITNKIDSCATSAYSVTDSAIGSNPTDLTTCSNINNLFKLSQSVIGTISTGTQDETKYYLSANMFKNRKFPGNFKYIDTKDSNRVCEVFIKEVIYANPATVVIWSDNTRTTSKTEFGDVYSGAFGLIYCILKKTQGTDVAVNVLRAWAPTVDEEVQLEQRQYRDKPLHKTLTEVRKWFKNFIKNKNK